MDIRNYFTHRDADGRPRPESYDEAIERLGMEHVQNMCAYLWKQAERLPLLGSLHAEQIVSKEENYGIYATIVREIAEQCNTAREKEIRQLQKQYPKKNYGELSSFYCSLPKYYLEKDFSRLIKMETGWR